MTDRAAQIQALVGRAYYHDEDEIRYLLGHVRELEEALRKLEDEHRMGPTPQRCINPDCGTIAYGMGYDRCPGCGSEPVLASGEA